MKSANPPILCLIVFAIALLINLTGTVVAGQIAEPASHDNPSKSLGESEHTFPHNNDHHDDSSHSKMCCAGMLGHCLGGALRVDALLDFSIQFSRHLYSSGNASTPRSIELTFDKPPPRS
jgi:hypothetical protein